MSDMNIKPETSKARESDQVIKARQKLEAQMAKEKKMIDSEAIQKTVESMKLWLTRHKEERVELKDKTIAPFDANKHPAKIKSKFVHQLLDQLKHQGGNAKPLEGRITQ